MNIQENSNKPNQQEIEKGTPIQLKLLLVGLVVTIIIWILEMVGVFY